MSLVKDILYSIPVSFIFVIFTHKLTEVLYQDLEYAERFQKSLITLFIIGVIGVASALTVFAETSRYKNRPIKFGLISGSIMLLIYSLITNWDKMTNVTKLLVIAMIFGIVVWFCYYMTSEPNKKIIKKKNKRVKEKKLTVQEDKSYAFDPELDISELY